MGARRQVVFYGVLFLSLFVFIHGFSKEVVTPVGMSRNANFFFMNLDLVFNTAAFS